MSSRKGTKGIKTLMYQLYGKRCMLCGYRPRGHQKKKCRNFLTYHHIKEFRYGGETTVQNGAILCNDCHCWFNKQPRSIQNKVNKYLMNVKRESRKF